MQDSVYLAWQYLKYNKLRTVILIACITITSSLPISLNLLLKASEKQLLARASTTPLLVGKKGSDVDLTVNSLYFVSQPSEAISMADVEQIKQSELAQPIPLDVRFQARNYPIVGTTIDYFDFRQLSLKKGTYFTVLGDCILGANVAQKLGLKPGDSLVSSPNVLFDLGGVYPLEMKVTGVLNKQYTADDDAIFTDIKTTWVIQGLGHGHQDLTKTGSSDVILNREKDDVTANAKLPQFTEITPENIGSFHFHGNPENFPLTAAIAVPFDQKSSDLLRGRYETAKSDRLILQPTTVIQALLQEIFKIQTLLNVILMLVALATLLAIVLIFNLSLQLRQAEIETSFKLGCSRATMARLITAEIIIILLISLSFTAIITAGLSTYRYQLTRTLISR
ncbi:MAG: ABC transporter permease [Synechocystis sp.]|nr:ABC transporter permease [Synechocystis sp.]